MSIQYVNTCVIDSSVNVCRTVNLSHEDFHCIYFLPRKCRVITACKERVCSVAGCCQMTVTKR